MPVPAIPMNRTTGQAANKAAEVEVDAREAWDDWWVMDVDIGRLVASVSQHLIMTKVVNQRFAEFRAITVVCLLRLVC